MVSRSARRVKLFSGVAACIVSAPNAYAAQLSLQQAVEAAQAALHTCEASGYDVTVTVLDVDLATRVALRGDRAGAGTVQIAYRKAYTVLKTGMSSGDFGKSKTVADGAPPLPGAPAGSVDGDVNLITWAGGLAIKLGSEVVGAISVSGAPGGVKDEACAAAGIAKIRDL